MIKEIMKKTIVNLPPPTKPINNFKDIVKPKIIKPKNKTEEFWVTFDKIIHQILY